MSAMVGPMQPGTTESLRYPWVYPGDFTERITRADLIISGTVVSTLRGKRRIVDGVEVSANEAKIGIDRIFKGKVKSATIQFLWFSPAPASGGVIYSGPPLADFRPNVRYLVFLRYDPTGSVVTIPIYAIEVRLAPVRSPNFLDLSVVPTTDRNLEIAKELEAAALVVPEPAPGVTGEAATYFPYVIDLLGGCAQPFVRHFAASGSQELRAAALSWLALLVNKGLCCVGGR
jgi:hypothetical protein